MQMQSDGPHRGFIKELTIELMSLADIRLLHTTSKRHRLMVGKMTRESDILFEAGRFWVRKETYGYVVYENGITHATSVQTFALDEDGLSLAKAYCNYLSTIR